MAQITFSSEQSFLSVSSPSVTQAANELLTILHHHDVHVGIYFVDRKRICELHLQYFNDDSFTDCMTFPIDRSDQQGYLGEIVICPEAAAIYSQERSADPYEELTRYLIHCCLHLHGYEDETDAGFTQMKELEEYYLKHLRKAGLFIKPE